MLLAAVNFTFYVGYDRYMSDIGNPGVTDALFTMFLLMSYDSLARGAAGPGRSILMATLVLYAGPVMFVLSVAAMVFGSRFPAGKRSAGPRPPAVCCWLTAAFYAVWGWCDGSLRYWIDTLDQEYVNHYLARCSPLDFRPAFSGIFRPWGGRDCGRGNRRGLSPRCLAKDRGHRHAAVPGDRAGLGFQTCTGWRPLAGPADSVPAGSREAGSGERSGEWGAIYRHSFTPEPNGFDGSRDQEIPFGDRSLSRRRFCSAWGSAGRNSGPVSRSIVSSGSKPRS